ncbi:MAG: Atxe2 family lasso peptide isopeptidase [Hyphomonadaceae bacterium]|nr:Atxe2 family lasso peptide isopeptidase [Hyphomonadaceae bacterium]
MVRRQAIGALFAVLFSTIAPAAAQSSSGPTIEDLAALRNLGAGQGGLALSPDGEWLAVFQSHMGFERNEVRYALVVTAARPGAAPRIVADAGAGLPHRNQGRASGSLVDRIPRWSPDSRAIAFIAEREGRAELWITDLTGRARLAARPDGDVTDFAWTSAHSLVLTTTTSRALVEAQRALDARDGFLVTDSFEPGFSLAPLPAVEAQRQWLHLDTRNRALTPADESQAALLRTPRRGNTWIGARDGASQVSRPPRGLFTTSDGASILCAVDACTGLLRDAGALTDGDVWFTRGEGPSAADLSLYVWTPTTQSVRRVRLAEERLYGCNTHGAFIYCLQEFSTQPRRIVSIDTRDGALAVIYDPNPQWRRFALPRVERLAFEDERGLQSYAHLVYPSDYVAGQRYPTIIVQYRSHGFLNAGVGGEYPIFPAAAQGYAVLSLERPEPRLREQQISRAELDHEMLIGDEEERMKLASLDGLLALAVDSGVVDPDRVAITGMSDGAETLYWALRDRHFAAAVASGPPIDPIFWWLADANFRAELRQTGLEAPDLDRMAPWWRHNATFYYADRIDTPLLMNLAQSEAPHAMPLYVQLHDRGAAVEAYIYPQAFHAKTRPSHVLAAQRRAMAWIDFWLRQPMSEDANDPNRAERWELMRSRSLGSHPAPRGAP